MLGSVVEGMPWTGYFNIDRSNKIISIPFCADKSESEILAEQSHLAREQKAFRILADWRDELLPVLGVKKRAVELERKATGLFGIATRGVHCTAYLWASGEPKLIIARRAATKSTYPGMLDNTIAGAQSSMESPWLAYIREGEEETGLPPSITSRAVAVSSVSYIHTRDARAGIGEAGLFQPESQYCYDLELHEGIEAEQPRVHDDEVFGFETMTIQQTWDCLMADEFKPNCGLVLIDFFIRWGFLRPGRDHWMIQTKENVPQPKKGWEVSAEDYTEIVSRLHRKLVFEPVETRLLGSSSSSSSRSS